MNTRPSTGLSHSRESLKGVLLCSTYKVVHVLGYGVRIFFVSMFQNSAVNELLVILVVCINWLVRKQAVILEV